MSQTVTVKSTGQTFSEVSESTLAVMERVYGTADLTWGEDHKVRVERVSGARYPYLPVCTCGHPFRGYAARHAAQVVADDHAS